MDRQKTVWWVLAAVVIAVAATLSAGTLLTQLLQKQWSHTDAYTADQVKSVQLNTGSAQVQVFPTTDGTARVTQSMHWVFSKPMVNESFDRSTGTLHIYATCEGSKFLGSSCGIELAVAVPATAAIDAEGGSGQLQVGAMTGPVTALTTSGEVDLSRTSGPLDIRVDSGQISGSNLRSTQVTAQAGSGEVDLDFDLPPTSVTAGVTSGKASVGLPRGTQYRVNASTTSGDTSVDPTLAAPSAAGTINVSVTGGEADVHYR
jgi:hypothetical protein